MKKGGRLSRKYILVLVALVAGTLLASGAIEHLLVLRGEQGGAGRAAAREGPRRRLQHRAVREGDREPARLDHPAVQLVAAAAASEQRRVDSIRLLKQVLAITELSYLDAKGLERLRVSRLAMDVIDSRIDYSQDPKFREAKAGRTYFGPVYFRKESEPYMTIAMPQSGRRRHGGRGESEVHLGRRVPDQGRQGGPGLRDRSQRRPHRAPRHQPGAAEDRR